MIYGFTQLIETKDPPTEEHLHLGGKHSQKSHGRGASGKIDRSGPQEEVPAVFAKQFKSAGTVPIASEDFTHTDKAFWNHRELKRHVDETWVNPETGARVELKGDYEKVPLARMSEVVNTMDDMKAEFPNAFFELDAVEVRPLKGDAWAHVDAQMVIRQDEGVGSIMRLNSNVFTQSGDGFERSIAGNSIPRSGERTGFHPEGTGTTRGVITHEFGHVVWNHTYFNPAPKGSPANIPGHRSEPGKFSLKPRGQMGRLSVYAKTNQHEAFAESFSFLYGRRGTFKSPKGNPSRFLEYKGPEYLHDVNKFITDWRPWL